MAWIRQTEEVPEPHASLLKRGNVIRSMSLAPEAMGAMMAANQTITFGGSALSRVEEAAIATAVSVVNRCRY
jgi:alkylhydroperoxidase family enzyme